MGASIGVSLESADGSSNRAGSLEVRVSSSDLGETTRSGEFTLRTAQANSLFEAIKISRDRLLVGSTVQATSTSTGALTH